MNIDDIKHSEDTLLGCAILNPATIDLVGDAITKKDWLTPGYAEIWAAFKDFRESGGPLTDVTAVIRMLERSNLLDRVGGRQTAARWASAIPGSESYHAGVLRRSGHARRLKTVAAEMLERIDADEEPASIALWTDCQLDSITHDNATDIQTIGEAAADAVRRIADAAKRQRTTALATGLVSLDDAVGGGFFPGEMIVVAARPSVGKTAFATQAAMHIGQSDPVLMLSLEMKAHELAMRQLAKLTGISMAELRGATVARQDWQTLEQAAESLHDVRVSLLYSRSATPTKLRAAARLARSSSGVSCVVVDYIGLMKASDPRKARWEQISEISASLKDLAMELDVPVVVLSQLNRMADKERPMLSHLRDSGSIEQDADVVLLLHRETKSSTDAVIDVAKNRQGATGPIEYKFDPMTTTFKDLGVKDMANYERAFDDYATSETPF